MSWQRSDPAPALLVHPPAAASLDEAHAAIEQWEFYSRKMLDSAQRLAVEHMLAENESGRWAARTTGRAVSRQNGKGDEFEVVESWGLTQRAEAIVHTAHEIPTAKSAHQRLAAHLEGHRDLRRLVRQIRYANGDQSIEMHNGGICAYRTRTSGGGRGLDDISRLVVDEAQHAQPEQLASSTPILAANPNPQINFAGTAGIGLVSTWWWGMRKRALSCDPGDFAWLEHSAETVSLAADGRVISIPPDPADRAAWAKANPGYPLRVEEGFLQEQHAILGPALFAREHLGVWDAEPGQDARWEIVDEVTWAACRRLGSTPTGPLAYALDVDTNAAGEEWCSIACSDGEHVEVVTPPDAPSGLGWVVAAVVTKKDRFTEIAIDDKGPAGTLVVPLEAAGVKVRKVKADELVQACGRFVDKVNAGQIVHIGQPVLDRAVAGATRKDIGDGAWRLSRSRSRVDISALIAVTLAHAVPAVAEADFFTI